MASKDWLVPLFWRWVWRISTLLLLQSLFLVPGEAQNRRDEVDALQTFRDSVEIVDQPATYGGSVVERRGYWSSWRAEDANPCAWVGVTCTVNSTVEILDLSRWGLSSVGSFQALSALPDLHQLDLSNNALGDDVGYHSFPEDVQTLANLVKLDLSGSNYGDPISPNISLCRGLRYLALGHNQFAGEVPDLSGLVNLQVLSLAENQLTGGFPKSLGGLTRLVSVDLSGNLLNGSIPSLTNLTNRLDLNVDNNQFPKFANLQLPIATNVEHLFLYGNQLEGVIPPGITKMLNLKVLNMSNNRLSGEIPSGLGFQVNHSFWLDLSLNNLTGQFLPTCCCLPRTIQFLH
jgi:Leucine-rich repeat (LRR) protein